MRRMLNSTMMKTLVFVGMRMFVTKTIAATTFPTSRTAFAMTIPVHVWYCCLSAPQVVVR